MKSNFARKLKKVYKPLAICCMGYSFIQVNLQLNKPPWKHNSGSWQFVKVNFEFIWISSHWVGTWAPQLIIQRRTYRNTRILVFVIIWTRALSNSPSAGSRYPRIDIINQLEWDLSICWTVERDLLKAEPNKWR